MSARRSTPIPTASRSASSPASRRSTSRPWCRCGCIRWRSPAATPSSSSPRSAIRRRSMVAFELFMEAGFPEGVLNVVHGDKEVGRRDPRPIPTSRRCPSSARRRSPNTSTGRGTAAREARPGARRRQEPHDRHARRRHRQGGRRADGRGLRLGRRALHGDLGRRAGRRGDRRTGWSSRSRRACERSRSARRPTRTPRWGRSSPSSTCDKVLGYIDAGVEARRRARRRRPRLQAPGLRGRLLSSAARCSTTSRRR